MVSHCAGITLRDRPALWQVSYRWRPIAKSTTVAQAAIAVTATDPDAVYAASALATVRGDRQLRRVAVRRRARGCGGV
ncbi:hypothetical protein [Catenuloplanes atrovinosus]|uniref:Uncharacterized protein n=1 Tax=Catenuloplanes atrovinosus TaxID=137266 RepID=A0AAE4CC90_9ACTN|nr:hypothetical protein [Catenuloplanes atrovinosus]MDR7277724.1 hypothetical protein [Catenuloplanes atrovinosus]